MLLLVAPPERSTARKTWPARPSGLTAPGYSKPPPRLTAVFRSKEGVWPAICALLERRQRNPVPPVQPPTKTLPLVSTSTVPYMGEFGRVTELCHVTPPFVERCNAALVPAQLAASYIWYWKPCPGPFVLSIVNHSLSPPALLSGDCSVHVCPPLVERHRSSQ